MVSSATVSLGRFDDDAHLEGDEDTPPTRSYVDALLEGNMTPEQIANLRAGIAGQPPVGQLRAPPHTSSLPPRNASMHPVWSETTPPPDDDDVRTAFRSYLSPTPPHGLDAVELAELAARGELGELGDLGDLGEFGELTGWGDLGTLSGLGDPAPPSDDDDARTAFRPSTAPTPARGTDVVDLQLDLDLGDEDDNARTAFRTYTGATPAHGTDVVDLQLGEEDDDEALTMLVPSLLPEAEPEVVEPLDETYLRALGGLAGVPSVVLSPAQLTAHPLGCEAGFVLSCLDGQSTIEDVLDISGFPRLDTLRLLYGLVEDGIVSIAPGR